MRYDGEHKARTRDRVLKEAAAAIRADGPDRLGVAAVMARAGLTHGGFYSHFASREELLSEAVGFMFKDRYATFFADVETVEPQIGLRRFVEFYLSMRHCDNRDSGCPIPILSAHLNRMPDAAQARFKLAVERLTSGITNLLTRAEVANPHECAVSAISEMVGSVALARIQSVPADAEAILSASRTSVLRKFGLVLACASTELAE